MVPFGILFFFEEISESKIDDEGEPYARLSGSYLSAAIVRLM